MKKIVKIILLFILLHFTVYPNYSFTSWKEDRVKYYELKKQFDWITKDVYFILNQKCIKYNLDIYFVCSIIYAESGGKNVVSKRNRNGSRDYGLLQTNSCWLPKNPEALLNPNVGFEISCKYLSYCIRKSNGNPVFTLMYYNGGVNCNRYKYKNFKYIAKIINKYSEVKRYSI